MLYVNRHSKHDFTHIGHLPHDKSNVKRGVKDVSKETLDVVCKLLENHCPTSIAQQFLELQDGGKLPAKSIANFAPNRVDSQTLYQRQ